MPDQTHSGRNDPHRLDGVSQAVKDALAARDLKDLHDEIDALRRDAVAEALRTKAAFDAQQKILDGFTADRNKALLWGVLALGGAVVAMGVFVAKLVLSKVGL